MPADPCTGALWRRLPTGLPSMAQPPRHKSPVSVPGHKVAHGALGSLPNLYAIIRERSFSERYRVAHGGGARGGASLQPPQRSTLRGRSPPPCGPGCARKPALDKGWHGFPESSGVKPRAVPTRVSRASHGASWRRTGGGDGGESDPHFFGAGAPPGRGRWCTPKSTTSPPLVGVALTTVIPGGKASGRPVALTVAECCCV